jgi:hypothetical protein
MSYDDALKKLMKSLEHFRDMETCPVNENCVPGFVSGAYIGWGWGRNRVGEMLAAFHEDLKIVNETGELDILFDGPPGPEAGRFVEVNDSTGKSVSLGEWIERPDGYWALRIPDPRSLDEPSI